MFFIKSKYRYSERNDITVKPLTKIMALWITSLVGLKATYLPKQEFPLLELQEIRIKIHEDKVKRISRKSFEKAHKDYPDITNFMITDIRRIDRDTGLKYNEYIESDIIFNKNNEICFPLTPKQIMLINNITKKIYSQFTDKLSLERPFGFLHEPIKFINSQVAYFNSSKKGIYPQEDAIFLIESLNRFYYKVSKTEIDILNITGYSATVDEVNSVRKYLYYKDSIQDSIKPKNDLLFLLDEIPNISADLLKTLLDWITKHGNNDDTIKKLEDLNIDNLNKLNLIVGISSLRNILEIWNNNQNVADEEYWQRVLQDNSIVLSQLFSFPIVITKGKAYVGGKNIHNSGGNIVDFLLSNKLTKNTVLIEIKTPVTKIIGAEYRGGIYNITQELSGAVIQVSSYKDSLVKEFNSLRNETDEMLDAFNPACLVIAGNFQNEDLNSAKRKSFELFRNGLKDVQVITFDELFTKVQILLHLLEGDID